MKRRDFIASSTIATAGLGSVLVASCNTNDKTVKTEEVSAETISDFEDTNNQLMNLKINEVMRTFTTLSFLTFPFVLIATIFGMGAKDAPFVNEPNGF